MRSFIEIAAPAKINLGLTVLGKRPDGFHEIRTTFVAINLYDRIRFTKSASGGVQLRLSGDSATNQRPVDFPLDESNLILRAVRQFEHERRQRLNLDIEVCKRIPTAAGLGGGSADAAATLHALTRLYGSSYDRLFLMQQAGALGSDVPFFLGTAVAEGRGRGEILRPLELFRDWWAVLVCPPIFVSANEVYGQLNLTSRSVYSSFSQCRDREGFYATLGRCHNDLEGVVARLVPEVLVWRESLRAMGAEVAFVSGSGPTVVGVFRRKPPAEALHRLPTRGASAQIEIVRPVTTQWALREV